MLEKRRKGELGGGVETGRKQGGRKKKKYKEEREKGERCVEKGVETGRK